MSLKLSNLQILIGFAPGPKFIEKKSGIKILTSTYEGFICAVYGQQFLPLIISKSDLPLSFHSDDSTFLLPLSQLWHIFLGQLV